MRLLMPLVSKQSSRRSSRFPMSSVLTLAFWRLQRTWFLLFVITLGMVAAVVIVGAIPLFSDVMTTAGLRNTLGATPDSGEIELNTGTLGMSTAIVHGIQNQFDTLLRQNLGTTVKPTQSVLLSTDFSLFPPPKQSTSLIVYGSSMQQAGPHLNHLQGRLATMTSTSGSDIEIMLSQDAAKRLGVHLGSVVPLKMNLFLKIPDFAGGQAFPPQASVAVKGHVVGIFTVEADNIAYWHGENFKPTTFQQNKTVQYFYSFLASNDALLALSDHVRSIYHLDAAYSASYGYTYRLYYHVDTSHLAIGDLDTLINQLANLQANYNTLYGDLSGNSSSGPPSFPYLSRVSLSSPVFSTADTPSSLERFRSRIDVARIPVAVLALQIIALILFFVSLMTSLLVDRQTDTVALLRSRGASSGQIFGALLAQNVAMGILAIIIGLPIAIASVVFLSQRFLPTSSQGALNIITSNPIQSFQTLIWYAVAIIFVAILTMSISLFFAARMDVLSMRRDAARTNKRPLWQRLNLDVLAGVIAIVGYALSFYLTNLGSVLQGDAKTLIATPLSIIAPFFLIIGCMFLFLRVFPFLLQLGARFAARGRGAVSLLALAQIARSPRQSVRMTLLLALSISFALFTLVYTATEAQHVQEIGLYQVGADFSGAIPTSFGSAALLSPTTKVQQYQAIPGVLSSSAGYVGQGEGGHAQLPMEIRAVDSESFARTVIWPSPELAQVGSSLVARLTAARSTALINDVLPAIVDTTTMNSLNLHTGSTFTIKVDSIRTHDLHCVIIGVVPHIPTINDHFTSGSGNTKGFSVIGGVLIDYQTYAAVYIQDNKSVKSFLGPIFPPSINHVWLHTKDDAASLASVRTALKQPVLHLDNLSDRRVLLAALNTDPLYLVLTGVLSIGTFTALLLALVGDLLASWLSARTRLTNFAILRAIGTTPQQVASVLTWEQAIVYLAGLLLGVVFGAILALNVIPALTFTDLNADLSTNEFYALQSALPTQVVIPPSLPIALLVLAVIYVVALTMMVRVVSKPSLSQTLRLNED